MDATAGIAGLEAVHHILAPTAEAVPDAAAGAACAKVREPYLSHRH